MKFFRIFLFPFIIVLAACNNSVDNSDVSGKIPIIGISSNTGELVLAKGLSLTLTATGGTEPYSWSVDDEVSATITDVGVFTGLAPASVVVTARDAKEFKSQVTIEIRDAELQSINIAPNPATVVSGGSIPFVATAIYTDQSESNVTEQASWSTTDPSVISFSSNGNVDTKMGSLGQYEIAITLGGKSATTILNIESPVITVSGENNATVVPKGLSLQMNASGGSGPYTYSVDSTDATITSGGLLTASTNPTVNSVTVTATDQYNFTGVATIGISQAVLESIEINPSLTQQIESGGNVNYSALGYYSDKSVSDITAQVTWASPTPQLIFNSSAAGSVTAQAGYIGTPIITASMGSISSQVSLNVIAPVIKVAGTGGSASVAAGLSLQMTVTGGTSPYTWSIQNPNDSGTITNTGLLTISNAPASTSLTVVAKDKNNFEGSISIIITAAVLDNIAITPVTPADIEAGSSTTLQATGTYSDGTQADISNSVVWSTSPTTGISVTPTGIVTSTIDSIGTFTITATLAGKSANVTVNVVAPTITVKGAGDLTSVAAGLSLQMSASGGGGTFVWSVNNTNGSINSSGLLTISNTPTSATILVIATDQYGYVGSITISVGTAALNSIVITPANVDVVAGGSATYQATGTYSDTTQADITNSVVWSTSATNVTLGTPAGTINTTASTNTIGTYTITATLEGQSTSSTLNVIAPSINISGTNGDTTVAPGLTLQLTVSGGTGPHVWSVGSTDASISSGGLLTAVANPTGTSVVVTATDKNGFAGTLQVNITAAVLTGIAIAPSTTQQIFAGKSITYSVTGTYSDNSTADVTNSVTWSATPPTDITFTTPAGTVQTAPKFTGSPTITATLQGSTSTVSLNVVAPIIAITGASGSSVPAGKTLQISANGGTPPYIWAVNTTGDTISASGLLTAGNTSEGTNVLVTATDFYGFSNTLSVAVSAATIEQITLLPGTTQQIQSGGSTQFTATGHYSNGTTADISSSVSWVASPATGITFGTPAGTVTAGAKFSGSVIIVASQSGKSAQVQLDVIAPTITVTGAGGATSVASGLTLAMSAAGGTAPYSWKINTTGDSISTGGILTAGPASNGIDVTVTATDANLFSGTQIIRVTPAVLQSITVSPATANVIAGAGTKFDASGHYSNATTVNISDSVNWSAVPSTSVTFGTPGGTINTQATPSSVGPVSITATYGTGSFSAKATLNIDAPLISVFGTGNVVSVPAGLQLQMQATGGSSSYTWSINTTSSTISTTGLLTAGTTAAGTSVVVTATDSNGFFSTKTITIDPAFLQTIAVTPASASVISGEPVTFAAQGTYSDGSSSSITNLVTWSTSANASQVTIASTGIAQTIAGYTGTTAIRATLSGVIGEVNLIVNSPTITVTGLAGASTVSAGQTLAMSASGGTAPYTWTVDAPLIASVNPSTGLLTGIKAGAVTVIALDASSVFSGSAIVSVVANIPPTITGQSRLLSTNEDTAITLTLADLVVTDPDNTYPNGFSLTINPPGASANYVTSGASITPVLNYNGPLTVPVFVNDGASNSAVYNINITVTPVNDAPVMITPSAISINENISAVVQLTASDVELDALTYTITGGADSSQFSINSTNNTLSFNIPPNYEASTDLNSDNIYEVTVSVSDSLSQVASTLFITIQNVIELPTITSQPTFDVYENNVNIGSILATDNNGGTSFSYSIVGGADALLFSVTQDGQLLFSAGNAPNYEVPSDVPDAMNTYEVTVQVSNTDGSQQQAITANVLNVADELDLAFNGLGYISDARDFAKGVATTSNGKIVVTGQSDAGGSVRVMTVWQFTDKGLPDTTFGEVDPNIPTQRLGYVRQNITSAVSTLYWDWGNEVKIRNDGKIVVAGSYIYSDLTDYDMAVWQFTPTGEIDTTFGDVDPLNVTKRLGYVIFRQAAKLENGYSMAIKNDNSIIVAGHVTTYVGPFGNTYDMSIWQYTPTGELDVTFGDINPANTSQRLGYSQFTAPSNGSSTAYAIDIRRDGKIVAAGSEVWLYTSLGELDTTFGDVDPRNLGKRLGYVSGITNWLTGPYIIDVITTPTNQIIAVGKKKGINADDMAVWQFTPTGEIDTNFGDVDPLNVGQRLGYVTHDGAGGGNGGTLQNDSGNAVFLTSTNQIIVAGNSYGGTTNLADMAVWQYTPIGELDTTFGDIDPLNTDQHLGYAIHHNAGGGGGNDYAYDVTKMATGQLILVGSSDYIRTSASHMTVWAFR